MLNLFSKDDLSLFAECVKNPQHPTVSPFHSPYKTPPQSQHFPANREHNHQYTCITLNRDTFDQFRRRKQKQSKSVFNKFCNKSAADKLAQSLPPEPSLETVYCWLALVLQYFKYPKMSPNGFLKPTPLCSAKLSARCTRGDSSPCCIPPQCDSGGGGGKKRQSCDDNNTSISSADISHICFNPLHWSLIQTVTNSKSSLISNHYPLQPLTRCLVPTFPIFGEHWKILGIFKNQLWVTHISSYESSDKIHEIFDEQQECSKFVV